MFIDGGFQFLMLNPQHMVCSITRAFFRGKGVCNLELETRYTFKCVHWRYVPRQYTMDQPGKESFKSRPQACILYFTIMRAC